LAHIVDLTSGRKCFHSALFSDNNSTNNFQYNVIGYPLFSDNNSIEWLRERTEYVPQLYIYATEKITRKASDAAENLQL